MPLYACCVCGVVVAAAARCCWQILPTITMTTMIMTIVAALVVLVLRVAS